MRLIITAIIAGELFSVFFMMPHPPYEMIWTSVILIALYLFYVFYQRCQFNHLPIWFLFIGVSFAAGFYWVEYLKYQKDFNQLDNRLDASTAYIVGYIDGLPRVSEKGVQFTLTVEHWDHVNPQKISDPKINTPRRISLFYPSFTNQFQPGQRWRFLAKVKQPHGLKNPYSFDLEYWMYINDIGAQGLIQLKDMDLISPWVWRFTTIIERARFYFQQKIQNSLGTHSPYVGVITALVIGEQQMIHQEDWRIFSATGIGHLISISGLHVTMLATFAASIGSWMWKKSRWIYWLPAQIASSTIGFFTAMMYSCLAGFQIPAQRTTLMVGAKTIGLWGGRALHPFDLWFWALLVVMLFNPWAVFSPGFWLSFGAVAAILFAMSSESMTSHDVDLLFIQKLQTSILEAIRVQAVVTIALIPLTLFWFYQISLISPLANAIAIPVVSFLVTPCAMLGAFLPFFLGDLFLYLSHFIFQGLVMLLDPMAKLEWAMIDGARPSGLHLWIALLGVVICIFPGNIRSSWKSRSCGLILCLSLFIPSNYIPGRKIDHGEFEMTVWDIGQGNAVFMQTKSHQLLFDTGPLSFGKFDPAEKVIIPHLRANGITQIDLLVISHQDADHIGGIHYLLAHYQVNHLYGSIPPQHSLQSLFHKYQVPFEDCRAGDSWEWDGVQFIIWHPHLEEDLHRQFALTKPNEMSCVLEVRNQHHSVWLTGDVEKRGESLMTQRIKSDTQQHHAILDRQLILMAPHHGSKTSSTQALIDTLDPQYVFSQTGFNNRYQHPHTEVVDRYRQKKIPLFDTVSSGAQIWRSEGPALQLQTWR